MRFFKLTRTQKIIRNLLLIGLCLFLLAWMLEFPCLTKQGLLNRAEREYLLTGPTELLFEDREGRVLYARNGELLLRLDYETTPLGLRMGRTRLYAQSDYLLIHEMDFHPDKENREYRAYVAGALEGVSDVELEVKLGTYLDQRTVLKLKGTQDGDFCFRFIPSEKEIEEGIQTLENNYFDWKSAVLRFYDSNGALLKEVTHPYLSWGENEGGRLYEN